MLAGPPPATAPCSVISCAQLSFGTTGRARGACHRTMGPRPQSTVDRQIVSRSLAVPSLPYAPNEGLAPSLPPRRPRQSTGAGPGGSHGVHEATSLTSLPGVSGERGSRSRPRL